MVVKEATVPIDSVAFRLHYIDNTARVAEFVRAHREEVTRFITSGFGELIERFNELDSKAPVMSIMPGAKKLKQALHGTPLPRPEDFSPREVLLGVKEAVPLMEDGERIKDKTLVNDKERIQAAIRTPSMETSELALAVGTAGHIMERTIFAIMRKIGVKQDWNKDDVLFALEETAMLMQEEFERGHGKSPMLYHLFVAPNKDGGLGWRKEEQTIAFSENYNALVS